MELGLCFRYFQHQKCHDGLKLPFPLRLSFEDVFFGQYDSGQGDRHYVCLGALELVESNRRPPKALHALGTSLVSFNGLAVKHVEYIIPGEET